MAKTHSPTRTRAMTFGAALGTAAAVLIGAVGFGGLGSASAEKSSGDRPVFISINPCRVTDTRPSQGVGGRTTPIGAAETHNVNVRPMTGDCSTKIPSDALSVQLNVTALNATQQTFLTLHPAGTSRPDASALNPAPGQPPTPNSVTTGINPSGEFSVYNNVGTVNVLIDISGYYVAHNHNDDRPSRINIGHTEFQGVTSQVDARFLGSGFTVGAMNQCMIAHLPLVEGSAISGVSLTAGGAAATTVKLSIVRVRHAPGTGLSIADVQAPVATGTITTTGAGNLVQGLITPPAPIPVALDTYNLYVVACSDDPFAVTGATIGVEYN